MVTVLKAAQAIAVTKLPPCEAKHVWGNWSTSSHTELAKFRQQVGMLAIKNVFNITPQEEII
jgi:hypothetical protein